MNLVHAHPNLVYGLGLGFVLLLGVVIRIRLFPALNGDLTFFVGKWYDHLQENGIRGFRDEFSNYNFPYLFCIYLATFAPLPKYIAIKLISVCFDLVLCYFVFALSRSLGQSARAGIVVAIATFLLPTVFLNSSYWGQTDAAYTAFLIAMTHSLLEERHSRAWIYWGVALGFKLQAAFLLPILVIMWLRGQGRRTDPFLGFVVFMAASIPPVLFGRGVLSTLLVYRNQFGYQPDLSAGAANFYALLPQDLFHDVNFVGVLLAIAVTTLVIIGFAGSADLSAKKHVILLATLVAGLIPSILPQMHERYFYPFEILMFVVAARWVSWLWGAALLQCIGVLAYLNSLYEFHVVPHYMSAVAMCAFVVFLTVHVVSATVRRPRSFETAMIADCPPCDDNFPGSRG